MKNIGWLIKNSIILDFKFLKTSRWSILKKVYFITLKYILVAKHVFKNFEFGKTYVNFSGKKIYYDCQFGLAGYQRMLSTHQNLIRIAGVKEARVIVDVGANVGFFSKLCREIFPDCNIYAFEPVPQIYECLEKNFKNDTKTKLFNIAISDTVGNAKMNFDSKESAVSVLSNDGNVIVQLTTLDNVINENNINGIDILKVDTETYEAHVLRGGINTLAITKYLFIEVNMEDNKNYTVSSLMKLLFSSQYDFQLVAFRNYDDKSEGEMPVMDAVFKNTKII